MSTAIFVGIAVACVAVGAGVKTLPAWLKSALGAAAAFACLEAADPFIPYPTISGPLVDRVQWQYRFAFRE